MIPASGAGGRGFESPNSPVSFFLFCATKFTPFFFLSSSHAQMQNAVLPKSSWRPVIGQKTLQLRCCGWNLCCQWHACFVLHPNHYRSPDPCVISKYGTFRKSSCQNNYWSPRNSRQNFEINTIEVYILSESKSNVAPLYTFPQATDALKRHSIVLKHTGVIVRLTYDSPHSLAAL